MYKEVILKEEELTNDQEEFKKMMEDRADINEKECRK